MRWNELSGSPCAHSTNAVAINEALAQQQRELENTPLADRLAETASSAAHDVKLLREILERL